MDTTTEPPVMGRTTIQVSDELADELHDRKERGDSYEDVIWRLIERAGSVEATDE
jgi:predicted CopG family antitoxin